MALCAEGLSCVRSITYFVFATTFIAGCSPLGSKPDQTENSPGTYSISTIYDGSLGGREQASEWLAIDAKNLCRSPYKLLSEKTFSTVNHLGEVTSSRLTWTVSCEPPPEEAPE
ncbi:hypothetical protein C8R31_101175 [Nitrosospira sp. Nsp2]|nr:hypothetical protein C8R31_101175 [Nitrosospira sp. Nsp2]